MKQATNLPRLEHFEPYTPARAMRRETERPFTPTAEPLSRNERVAGWTCRLIAAGIMLETLFFKFTGAPESVYIFSKLGMESWWRYGQGIWELIASLLLLMPRLGWAGGILTLGAMGGAIVSHLTILGIAVRGDGGLLFAMAVVTFLCGGIVTFLHRQEIPAYTPLTPY